MTGLRQTRPGRVYQTATQLLEHRTKPHLKVQKPVWYNAVESIPPSEMLTRPLPPQHKVPDSRTRKPSRLFQPQHLVYEEDALRRNFYKDHPWELARPRMIVEMDGRDAEHYDWSKGLRQPGMPLCGESVVQRQLWMMHNVQGITQAQAYDIVRREFYELRQQEDIERRIAKEEAMHVGSYFGKTFTQIGIDLEGKQFDTWRKWAGKQIDLVRNEADAAYTNFGDTEEGDGESVDGFEAEEFDAEEGQTPKQ